ncbi:MAG TPA: serine hydrolase, partial [Chitinophaga sp.]|uniref:serine hydrolase n=1 Tax=Chitinophaga sp. TaxID=1869181 RepID=UPI002F92D8E6
MKRPFTLLLALYFSLAATAQTTALIDSIVQHAVLDFMKDTARVGLSVGIYKDGRTYTFHQGSTQRGKALRPDNNTIYEIGSISKTFTGFLLARAIADKKINPDDDIRKYLHDPYPNLAYNGKPVKIMH